MNLRTILYVAWVAGSAALPTIAPGPVTDILGPVLAALGAVVAYLDQSGGRPAGKFPAWLIAAGLTLGTLGTLGLSGCGTLRIAGQITTPYGSLSSDGKTATLELDTRGFSK